MDIQLINGLPGHLPLDNRGLAYGDGVFETILLKNGRLQFLDQHLNRLLAGVLRLDLAWTATQQSELINDLKKHTDSVQDVHVVKIMLTRKAVGRGYAFNHSEQSVDCIILIKPYTRPAWVMEGAIVQVATIFASENKSLAGLKHLNRLDSVLARASIPDANVNEVLMQTSKGLLVEGSMSNVFLLNGENWETPNIKDAGVAGIIRAELLTEFSDIKVCDISLSSIEGIKAGFITNSLIGIAPIVSLNGKTLNHHPDIFRFSDRLSLTC